MPCPPHETRQSWGCEPGRENGLAAWPVSRHSGLAVEVVCHAVVSCTDHSVLDRMFADVHYISSVNLLSLCKEEQVKKRMMQMNDERKKEKRK